jgi:hypothetical protein
MVILLLVLFLEMMLVSTHAQLQIHMDPMRAKADSLFYVSTVQYIISLQLEFAVPIEFYIVQFLLLCYELFCTLFCML